MVNEFRWCDINEPQNNEDDFDNDGINAHP